MELLEGNPYIAGLCRDELWGKYGFSLRENDCSLLAKKAQMCREVPARRLE